MVALGVSASCPGAACPGAAYPGPVGAAGHLDQLPEQRAQPPGCGALCGAAGGGRWQRCVASWGWAPRAKVPLSPWCFGLTTLLLSQSVIPLALNGTEPLPVRKIKQNSVCACTCMLGECKPVS